MNRLYIAESGSMAVPEKSFEVCRSSCTDSSDRKVRSIRKRAARSLGVLDSCDPLDPDNRLLAQYDDVVGSLALVDEKLVELSGFPSRESIASKLKELSPGQREKLAKFADPQLIIVPPMEKQELEWTFENPSNENDAPRLENNGVETVKRERFEVCVIEGGEVPADYVVDAAINLTGVLEDALEARSEVEASGLGCAEADEYVWLRLKKFAEEGEFLGETGEYLLNASYILPGDKRLSVGSFLDDRIYLDRRETELLQHRQLAILPVLRLDRK